MAHVGPAAETIAAYVSDVSEGAQGGSTASPLVVRGVELLTDGRIVSGCQILYAPGQVVDSARLHDTSGVGIRVRSMQNGRVLFATSSLRHGVSLEGSARFTLDVGLQLNTAPGVYAIETAIFDRKRGQTIANGPWVNVTVHEGKSFVGEVQMNPEMVLRSLTPAERFKPNSVLPRSEPRELLQAPARAPERA